MGYLFLSAAHKSSGKTTLSIGLGAALRSRRNLVVQPFKKGPDYIDPLWLGAAAGRPCHNLDFFVQDNQEISATFRKLMKGVDIGLVEGNKGLFDGVALDGSNSNAALAALLDAPVVLVVDTRGVTRGIAPLLLGYQQFTPRVNIAGVILNRVGAIRHETKLRQAVEHYTDIPVLGAVRDSKSLQIVERHLGLMPSNEHEEAAAIIRRIADAVAEQVDLDAVIEVAQHAPAVLPAEAPAPGLPPLASRVRIAIARDAAFGFYYPGDLDALEAAGAELVYFDALHDAELPKVDGLFIGGGFPETHMEALERNRSLRNDVAAFIESGGPAYAECGGLMYLCRSLTWGGKACRMAGVIQADAVMDERPQGRGYVLLRETESNPWPAQSELGNEIAAHEFHYSRLENIDGPLTYAYDVTRGHGVDGKHDGIVYKNLLAGYAHLRDVAQNHWASRYVAHVKACKQRKSTSAPEVREVRDV